MMIPEPIIVVTCIVLILVILITTKIAPEFVFLGFLALLMIFPDFSSGKLTFGIITAEEGLSGFSNSGVITVAFLYIVARGLRNTGAVDYVGSILIGTPKGLTNAVSRVVLPVAGISAFVNNTPLVSMVLPMLIDLSKRIQISPSKLLIPLSYAAVLGGTCSLIGTSTNLVVNGLLVESTGQGMGMFDITPIGLPCAFIGCLYLIFIAPKILPDRGSLMSVFDNPKEYTVEMIVPANSNLIGKTIQDAGLRNLPSIFLVEISRGEEIYPAVDPHHVLKANDRLLFVGMVESVKDLHNIIGLDSATDQLFKLDAPRYWRQLFEAVISSSSPVAGKTIREAKFRTRYGAVVLAVARNSERIKKKIGDIVLQAGDTLLIEATPNFMTQYKDSGEFLLISSLEDSTPRTYEKGWISGLILVGMILSAAFKIVTMLQASMVAAFFMIATKCCTISQARKSIDSSVLLVIAASLGVAKAIDASGTSDIISQMISSTVHSDPVKSLIFVYIITSILTEILSNSSAVALIFPIIVVLAKQLNVDLMPFVMVMTVAASASFATPFGYQTNLMVYGPGGYKFVDFLKVGLPLNVICFIVTILATLVFYKF